MNIPMILEYNDVSESGRIGRELSKRWRTKLWHSL